MFHRITTALFFIGVAGVVAVVGIFLWYGRDLPSIEALTDYRPSQMTRVYDRAGLRVGEFFLERRTVLPPEKIPTVVKRAAVASEDASFYEHSGVDYAGILRALFRAAETGHLKQGGSTITQQVVKNLVLSPERTMARKVKEAILAYRLEKNLTKEQILSVYLNHMNFGHARYGIEEAAQFFLAKSATQLNLGEAALLVGLLQGPERLSPFRWPDRAKRRQGYVLNQMADKKMISRADADAEIVKPLALAKRSMDPTGPYYMEEVRKQLLELFGKDVVLRGGLKVEIAMDGGWQQKADAALRAGLEEVDRRMGFRPPELKIDLATLEPLRAKLFADGRGEDRIWVFDRVGEKELASLDKLEDAIDSQPLAEGLTFYAPAVEATADAVVFDLGIRKGVVTLDKLKWARPWSPGKGTPAPKRASDVMSPGMIARVRVVSLPTVPEKTGRAGSAKAAAPAPPDRTEPYVELALVPIPTAQGALVAIDPMTKQVLALSGGYAFGLSPFNRATQARRQPGSAFKPFLYAAAIESRKFTAATLVGDAPEIQVDSATGKEWRPRNFEKDVYDGAMTLREALAKSKNTVSVRVMEKLGPSAVVEFARRAGIESPLPEAQSLALGTGEVSPLELANTYSTLAALGRKGDPILVTKVTDPLGTVLFERKPETTRLSHAIEPGVAFIATSMMRSVVESGTAQAAKALKRPAAGKTGTTQGHHDAWFAGYTPELVAVVWVGFDEPASMGGSETGGRAALPIWTDFMTRALGGRTTLEFVVPDEVEAVSIDPKSGLLAAEGAVGQVEYFLEGTAPKGRALPDDEADPALHFMEDGQALHDPDAE